MHDPYARTVPGHPRSTGSYAFHEPGLGRGPWIGPPDGPHVTAGVIPAKPAGGAVQPTPFGGQVAPSHMHNLPKAHPMFGRGTVATTGPIAPQIPMPAPSPYSNAGGQSQQQQQYVSQSVSVPVTVTTQPQLSATFNPNPVSQDLGPTVPSGVADGISAFASKKCLLWLIGGAALAYFSRGR